MKTLISWFTAGILISLAVPAAAQYRGQMAFGLGPNLVLPTQAAPNVGFGISGDIEYYLSHRWSTSLETAIQWANEKDSRLNHAYLGLSIGFHSDMGRWHPLFKGGTALYHIEKKSSKKDPQQKDTALGAYFGLGIEHFAKPTFSVRLEIQGHDIFSNLDASFIVVRLLSRFYF